MTFNNNLEHFTFRQKSIGFCIPERETPQPYCHIGGGGSGSTFGIDGSFNHGAGGSGYIESIYIDRYFADSYLVKVGNHGQNSIVENGNGETILIANYGFENLYDNGGHGYSGGGSK